MNITSPRRQKNYWTKKETEILKEAVYKHGKKWSVIQKEYSIFKENNRSQIDLKDKWRNLEGRKKPILLDSGDHETLNYIILRRLKSKSKSKKRNKKSAVRGKNMIISKSKKRSKNKSKSKKRSNKSSIKRSKSKSNKRSKKSSIKRSKSKSKKRSKKSSIKRSKNKSKKSKSKPKYIIYSIEGCSYCKEAKELLKSKKIPFKEIKVTDSNIEKIYKNIDKKTKKYRYFPIIFKNNIFIGGFSDLDKNL
jgi:glutaredoxin